MLKDPPSSHHGTITTAVTHAVAVPRKLTAYEVRRMPKAERERYMLEHTAQAAKEYAVRPELLIDGGSELIDY